MGTFHVRPTGAAASDPPLWEKSGNQGSGWSTAVTGLQTSHASGIEFVYIKGSSYRGDAAIGMVTIECDATAPGASTGDTTTTTPADTTTTSPADPNGCSSPYAPYPMITTGSCASHGYGQVASAAECSTAITHANTATGVSYNSRFHTVTATTYSWYPNGCFSSLWNVNFGYSTNYYNTGSSPIQGLGSNRMLCKCP